MPITATEQVSLFPVWSTSQDPLPAGISRYESLPTPEDVKSRSLFGIPLYSSITGQTYPDSSIQTAINRAISEVELLTDLYINPVTFKDKYDYNREVFAWNFCYIKLNHPNVLKVTKVEVSFINSMAVEGFVSFPLEHVVLMPQEGVIQLVPAIGTTFGSYLLTAFAGAQFQAMRHLGTSDFPGAIRVEYQCGFEPGKLPAAIAELIEVTAAIDILSTIGRLLYPFSSYSIGIDGVSQSNSTPGPEFLSNRVSDLNARKQELVSTIKGYFQRTFLVDYF